MGCLVVVSAAAFGYFTAAPSCGEGRGVGGAISVLPGHRTSSVNDGVCLFVEMSVTFTPFFLLAPFMFLSQREVEPSATSGRCTSCTCLQTVNHVTHS